MEDKIFTSLATPDTFLGLPRNVLSKALAFSMMVWSIFLVISNNILLAGTVFLAIFIFSISILKWFHHKDPFFFEIFTAHLTVKHKLTTLEPPCLDDVVPWLFPPFNKDGGIQVVYRYENHDYSTKSEAEIQTIINSLNNVLKRLEGGWAIFHELQRVKVKADFFPQKTFSNRACQIIQEEQKEIFFNSGAHVNRGYIIICYNPAQSGFREQLYSMFRFKRPQHNFNDELDYFNRRKGQLKEQLKPIFPVLQELNPESDEYWQYLHSCISTKDHQVSAPANPIASIADETWAGGKFPKIGDHHVRVISVKSMSTERCEDLYHLPFEFRRVDRFIVLPNPIAFTKKLGNRHFSNRFSFKSHFAEVVNPESAVSARPDQFSETMAEEAEVVCKSIKQNNFSIGDLSTTITVWDRSSRMADHKAQVIEGIFNSKGNVAVIEETNAMSAMLGSLPGEVLNNPRRLKVTSYDFARLFPGFSWIGQIWNDHLNDLPLFYAKSQGSTPYIHSSHVLDLANLLLVGVPGAGKSFLVKFMVAMFLQYKKARIFFFDKDSSAKAFATFAGGNHYNIGIDTRFSVCPFSDIHISDKRIWIVDWLQGIVYQEGLTRPGVRKKLTDAVNALAEDLPKKKNLKKNFETLLTYIEDRNIKETLEPYAKSIILNGDRDSFKDDRFAVFEIGYLMSLKGMTMPYFSLMLKKIEGSVGKEFPNLAVIDEASSVLNNATFGPRVNEWFRVMRKKNCGVWLLTQALADISNNPFFQILIEASAYKIFTANPNLNDANIRKMYSEFGLSEKELNIIQNAIPKKEYFVKCSLGSTKFNLGIQKGSASQLICGSCDPQDLSLLKRLKKENGDLLDNFLKEKQKG